MSAKRLARLVCALVLVIGCSAAVAAAAAAASLKLVIPANAHANRTFSFSIKGTFSKSNLTGKKPRSAYVVVLKQPKTFACQATESKDYTRIGPSRLVYRGTQAHSPFDRKTSWSPPAGDQDYRLCAYLYSQPFSHLGDPRPAKLLASTNGLIHS